MRKSIKIWLLLVISLAFCLSLAVVASAESPCEHETDPTQFISASCEAPKTCRLCGATEGSPLGHMFDSPMCEKPETCRLCGKTRGDAPPHYWAKATCTAPRICSTCGKRDGEPLGHKWSVADCVTAPVCSACAKVGEIKGHVYDNSCDKDCNICMATRDASHTDINQDSFCDRCSITMPSDGLNGGEIAVIIILPLFSVAAGVGVYFLLTKIKKKKAQKDLTAELPKEEPKAEDTKTEEPEAEEAQTEESTADNDTAEISTNE